MKYSEALRVASKGTVIGITDRKVWRALGEGLEAVLVLCIRLIVLITYPISTPLIAWAIKKNSEESAKRSKEIREKLRTGIHRNGP